MDESLFLKAQELYLKIRARKGVITTLTQRVDKEKNIAKKQELNHRLLENISLLSNLKKEFKDL